MPHATTDDGVRLYYEEAGEGVPVVFVHEFAGDHRSWEPQLRFFSRRHRCLAFAARGYPPSDVPADPRRYSQARAAADIVAVLDGAGIERAHVVGLSMGAFATLHFGLDHPERALSLVCAGIGYGAEKAQEARFPRRGRGRPPEASRARAAARSPRSTASGAARVQFQAKDPRGWREMVRWLGEHDAGGAANTMRGVQARRPSLYDLEVRLRELALPVLIVAGDEDDHTSRPASSSSARSRPPGCWCCPRPATRSTSRSLTPSTGRSPISSPRSTPAAGCRATPAPAPRSCSGPLDGS